MKMKVREMITKKIKQLGNSAVLNKSMSRMDMQERSMTRLGLLSFLAAHLMRRPKL